MHMSEHHQLPIIHGWVQSVLFHTFHMRLLTIAHSNIKLFYMSIALAQHTQNIGMLIYDVANDMPSMEKKQEHKK